MLLFILKLYHHGQAVHVAYNFYRQCQAVSLILISFDPGGCSGQEIPFLTPVNQLIFTVKIKNGHRLNYKRIGHSHFAPFKIKSM